MDEEETRPTQQEPTQTPAPQSPIGAGIAENTWAMVVHLAALSGCLIPFGNIIVSGQQNRLWHFCHSSGISGSYAETD